MPTDNLSIIKVTLDQVAALVCAASAGRPAGLAGGWQEKQTNAADKTVGNERGASYQLGYLSVLVRQLFASPCTPAAFPEENGKSVASAGDHARVTAQHETHETLQMQCVVFEELFACLGRDVTHDAFEEEGLGAVPTLSVAQINREAAALDLLCVVVEGLVADIRSEKRGDEAGLQARAMLDMLRKAVLPLVLHRGAAVGSAPEAVAGNTIWSSCSYYGTVGFPHAPYQARTH